MHMWYSRITYNIFTISPVLDFLIYGGSQNEISPFKELPQLIKNVRVRYSDKNAVAGKGPFTAHIDNNREIRSES
jgi:hypothetical protein